LNVHQIKHGIMKHEVKPELLRQMNARTIFELLQLKGPSSRAELSKISKISAPTVSRTVDALIKASLLEELGSKTEPGVEGGRPATLVKLATKSALVIGVVLDVTHCQLAMTGLDGQIKEDHHFIFPTPKTYTTIIDTFVAKIKQLKSKSKGKVVGICLTAPGFNDRDTGAVIYSPNLHVLNGHKPRYDIEKLLGQKVIMFPESDALCLGENMFGKGKGNDDMAIIDISYGCGVGMVRNGELITAKNQLGMELGHIPVQIDGEKCGCGNRGCLETIVTDRAFAKAVSQRLEKHLNIGEIVDLIQRGHINADEEINTVLEYLAVGVAVVINILNPHNIFIYGKIFDIKQELFEQFLDRVHKKAFYPIVKNCKIQRSSGDKINGAIAGALNHLTNSLGPKYSS
jgi:predicted NBD/HSP70 family sugar kinase